MFLSMKDCLAEKAPWSGRTDIGSSNSDGSGGREDDSKIY